MQKIISLILVVLSTTAFAQSYKINANEDPKEFVARIAPPEAKDVKMHLKSVFNTSATKLVYSFYSMESGAIIKDKDSSKCVYVSILIETSNGSNEFTQQTFRTNCNYRSAISLSGVSIIEEKKHKKLQVDVTEVVRGPGGLLRNVTRNYVYTQKKDGNTFTDVFDVVNE